MFAKKNQVKQRFSDFLLHGVGLFCTAQQMQKLSAQQMQKLSNTCFTSAFKSRRIFLKFWQRTEHFCSKKWPCLWQINVQTSLSLQALTNGTSNSLLPRRVRGSPRSTWVPNLLRLTVVYARPPSLSSMKPRTPSTSRTPAPAGRSMWTGLAHAWPEELCRSGH